MGTRLGSMLCSEPSRKQRSNGTLLSWLKMRPSYDFSAGIRGKYAWRLDNGANVVVLDRDVAKIFPDSKAVNDALRALAEAGKRHGKAKGGRRSTQPHVLIVYSRFCGFSRAHLISNQLKENSSKRTMRPGSGRP